jgi:hypothetical protein
VRAPAPRGHPARPAARARVLRRVVRCGAVALGLGAAACGACAPATRYESPGSVRGYDILITRQDSLARAIADGLRRRGFTVRDHVTGGGRPTAYLFAFLFRETDPPAVTWLDVRVADTRTGAIVAAVSLPLDSLAATPVERAQAVVDSLAGAAALRPPPPPS